MLPFPLQSLSLSHLLLPVLVCISDIGRKSSSVPSVRCVTGGSQFSRSFVLVVESRRAWDASFRARKLIWVLSVFSLEEIWICLGLYRVVFHCSVLPSGLQDSAFDILSLFLLVLRRVV